MAISKEIREEVQQLQEEKGVATFDWTQEIDGNAFGILGMISKNLKRKGYSEEDIKKYNSYATESSYDHLVAISMLYCPQAQL